MTQWPNIYIQISLHLFSQFSAEKLTKFHPLGIFRFFPAIHVTLPLLGTMPPSFSFSPLDVLSFHLLLCHSILNDSLLAGVPTGLADKNEQKVF